MQAKDHSDQQKNSSIRDTQRRETEIELTWIWISQIGMLFEMAHPPFQELAAFADCFGVSDHD